MRQNSRRSRCVCFAVIPGNLKLLSKITKKVLKETASGEHTHYKIEKMCLQPLLVVALKNYQKIHENMCTIKS